MARPGTQILSRETPPPRSAPTDTGVWFVAGLTEKGPASPVLVSSMSDFTRELGSRQSYSILYDAVETYFREGGGRVYVSRVLGPAAAAAFVVLDDGAGADTLRVEANSAGEWGNALNVAIEAGATGGTFVIVISHDTLGELERSPELVDKTAAFSWAAGSDYVTLVDQASALDPAVVAVTGLATGADDRASVVDAQWQTALDRFTADLGPGQVSFPGRTTTAAHTALLAHAATKNRVAFLDTADTTSKATMIAAAAALRTLANARYGALFGPWVRVPGLTAGTTRDVPYSAVQAGLTARLDGQGGNPNAPAAGINGEAQFALEPKASFSDDDREDLNEAGVNIGRSIYGGLRTYGYRTLVDPEGAAQTWLMLNNARLYMAVAAQADVIAERYVFAQLDGRRHKISQYGGELTGMLAGFWDDGALYGETSEEAFNVDVGAQVNTDATIAAGELRAVIAMRMSPFAELVVVELVKVAITEGVA